MGKYHILDTGRSPKFDNLTKLAVEVCKCEVAFISIFDDRQDRHWFKSVEGIGFYELPLSKSIIQPLLIDNSPFVNIPDIDAHPHYKEEHYPLVEAGVKFFAGYPLISSDEKVIGAFCVAGFQPKVLDDLQLKFLAAMADQAMYLVEANLANYELVQQSKLLEKQRKITQKAAVIGKMGGLFVSIVDEEIFWTPINNNLFGFSEDFTLNYSDFLYSDLQETRAFRPLFLKLRKLLLSREIEETNFSFKLELANMQLQIQGEVSNGELYASFHDNSIHYTLNHELRTYKVLMEQVEEMVKLGGWSYDLIKDEIIWTKNVYAIYEIPLNSKVPLESALSYYEGAYKVAIRKDFERLLHSGRAYHSEYLLKSTSGKLKWVKANGFPIYSDGKLVRLTGSIQDITKDKKLNDELKKSKRKAIAEANYYKSLVNNETFYVCKTASNGKITFCNELYLRRFQVDLTLADCEGMGFFDNIAADYYQRSKEIFTAIATGITRSQTVSVHHNTPSGKIIKCYWNFTGIKDADGKVMEVLCLGYDVSELEESKARVQYLTDHTAFQKEKLISYNSIVSHDIRSHVANSIGLLNLMDFEGEGAQYLKYYQLLKKEVHKLDKTIESLDKITSAQTIKQREKESIHLIELVDEVFDTLQTLHPSVHFLKINAIPQDFTIFTVKETLYDILLKLPAFFLKDRVGNHEVELKIAAFNITENLNQIEISLNGAIIDPKIQNATSGMNKLRSIRDYRVEKKVDLKLIEQQLEVIGGKMDIYANKNVGSKIILELIDHGS